MSTVGGAFRRRIAGLASLRRPLINAAPRVAQLRLRRNGNGGMANGGDFMVVFQNFVNYVKIAVSNGTFLITLAVVCYVLFSYQNHEDNIIRVGINKLIADPTFKHVGEWLSRNVVKFVGFIAFIPAVVNAPANKQALTGVLAFLWVWFVPEHNSFEYIIQGVLLYLFVKTKSDKYKLMVFVMVLMLYFGQYIITSHHYKCDDLKDRASCVRNCVWDTKAVPPACINRTTTVSKLDAATCLKRDKSNCGSGCVLSGTSCVPT